MKNKLLLQELTNNASTCTINSNISRHLCLVSRHIFKSCDISLEILFHYL